MFKTIKGFDKNGDYITIVVTDNKKVSKIDIEDIKDIKLDEKNKK